MELKVCVLGGGGAGFLAATAIATRVPRTRVRVVRSKEIGIIGVGEGSTIVLTDFLHKDLKVGRRAFFEQVNATWKLGLRFIWGTRPHFDYTFGSGTAHTLPDSGLPRPIGYYAADDMTDCEPYTALMRQDRVFAAKSPGMPLFHNAIAYHFENEKFVNYLESLAASRGVEIVDDTVRGVRRVPEGAGDRSGDVAALELASGGSIEADLFVDCSGFGSALLGKALGEPFDSYANSLFCERAVVGGWARPDDPNDPDYAIRPYTTCETMDAGWCWRIEHEGRVNRGYVYAPSFISDEEAEREFRTKNRA